MSCLVQHGEDASPRSLARDIDGIDCRDSERGAAFHGAA